MPPKIYHFINTLNFWSLRSLECQMSILGQLVQRFYLPKLWLWSSANFSTNAKSTAWYFSIFIPMALFFKETVVAEFSSSALRPSVTYFFEVLSNNNISSSVYNSYSQLKHYCEFQCKCLQGFSFLPFS